MVATVGRGRERGRSPLIVGAATADSAHSRVGGGDGEGVLSRGVGLEVGGVGGVAGHRHSARVLCVAVLPLCEVVATVGRGREHSRGALVIGTAAADGAHSRVGGGDGYGIFGLVIYHK